MLALFIFILGISIIDNNNASSAVIFKILLTRKI